MESHCFHAAYAQTVSTVVTHEGSVSAGPMAYHLERSWVTDLSDFDRFVGV